MDKQTTTFNQRAIYIPIVTHILPFLSFLYPLFPQVPVESSVYQSSSQNRWRENSENVKTVWILKNVKNAKRNSNKVYYRLIKF